MWFRIGRSWRAASLARFRRSAEFCVGSALALGCLALWFLLLGARGRLWTPTAAADILWAGLGLAALAALTAAFGRVAPWAAWTQRRQLSDDRTSARDAERDTCSLPVHVMLGGSRADEYGHDYESRCNIAKVRTRNAEYRLDRHERRGRSVRLRRRWALALGAFAVGLAAAPWATWTEMLDGDPSVLVPVAAAQAMAFAAAVRSVIALVSAGERWPPELGKAPNVRSFSPLWAIAAAPVLGAYSWSWRPEPSWIDAFAAAGPAFLALAAVIGLRKLLASSVCTRLESAWERRNSFRWQRRLERLVTRSALAASAVLYVTASLLLALAVAISMAAPATAGNGVGVALCLAVFASWLGQLGSLRVDRDGAMIPASAIDKAIEKHPLGGSGIVAALTLLAGLAAAL